MAESPKIKLFSHREWKNKASPNVVAIQFYHWVPRVLIIDETVGRKILEDLTLEYFIERTQSSCSCWELTQDWEYEDGRNENGNP
jgi:hypothetical protein